MPHVVHLTCSSFFGGPERQILGLSTHLAGDFQNTLVVFSENGKCCEFQDAARLVGVPCYTISDDLSGTFSLVNQLKQIIVNIDADVLCCHGYKANLIGNLTAQSINLPIVIILRGWTGENKKVKIYEMLDKAMLTKKSLVICLSNAQVREVIKVGVPEENIRLIPNAVSLERFSQRVFSPCGDFGDYFPNKSNFICCSAGRLSPEKGFVDLVYVAKESKKKKLPVNFVLFGDGPLRSLIHKTIIQEDLEEQFYLPGFSTKLDNILPSCDILLIPSYTEGIPNILLEGLAAGVAVVATCVGGIPDLITDGRNGFLVQPGDVATMSKRIELLTNDKQLRSTFNKAGRMLVESGFSFDLQAEKYRALFHQIIDRSVIKNN